MRSKSSTLDMEKLTLREIKNLSPNKARVSP